MCNLNRLRQEWIWPYSIWYFFFNTCIGHWLNIQFLKGFLKILNLKWLSSPSQNKNVSTQFQILRHFLKSSRWYINKTYARTNMLAPLHRRLFEWRDWWITSDTPGSRLFPSFPSNPVCSHGNCLYSTNIDLLTTLPHNIPDWLAWCLETSLLVMTYMPKSTRFQKITIFNVPDHLSSLIMGNTKIHLKYKTKNNSFIKANSNIF